MARLSVVRLIERAYELIGVKAEQDNLETFRQTKGLEVLRARLAAFSSDPTKLPYRTTISFNTVAAQEVYEIGVGKAIDSTRLIAIAYLTIRDSNVIDPLLQLDAETYWNNRRLTDSRAKPTSFFLIQELEATKIILLPTPSSVHEITVVGKFELPLVSTSSDIEDILPANWDQFLIYDVAKHLVNDFPSSVWDGKMQQTYVELIKDIRTVSDVTNYPIIDARLGPWFGDGYATKYSI